MNSKADTSTYQRVGGRHQGGAGRRMRSHARRHVIAGLLAAASALVLLVACSSTDTGTNSGSGSGYGGPAPASATSAASGAAMVMVKNGALGAYLTDASGRTLYLFVPDTTNKSTCTGSCAVIWPPLTTSGAPQAGTGATASKLATSARSDGNTQVTYNGHPLYYYQGDTSPGQTSGQGLNQSGGLWWVVSPEGNAIT